MSAGCFLLAACRRRYRMVAARPRSSHASRAAPYWLGARSVIPHAMKPSSWALALTSVSPNVIARCRAPRSGDEASATLEREIRPGPIDQDQDPIAKPNQVEDVNEDPEEPREEPRGLYWPNLGDRPSPPDDRELALVAKMKRLSRPAGLIAENGLRRVTPHLDCGRTRPR